MTQNDQRIVVALGGNAILRSKNLSSYHEQFENVRRSCRQVVQLIAEGYQPIFTHGNGPETQGQIGYMIQQAPTAYRSGHVDQRPASRYRGRMQTPLTLRRWQRAEYDRLVGLGVFQGEPLELIGGQLVVAEPQGSYHASAITRVDYALRAIVPPGWIVRLQAPVSLDEESEPEPDVAVVPGRPGDYRDSHPAHPALLVEVAESSLELDRTRKGSLYARAAVADYWIVNLVEGVVEVYRDPEPDASAAFGYWYRSVTRLAPPATVVPLAFSGEPIAVADLLP